MTTPTPTPTPTPSSATATPAQYKRKILFVDGLLQGSVLRHIVMYWTAYHLFLWNAMFLYRYLEYRGAVLAGARPQTFAELYRQFTLEHYSIIVCAVAILPLVLWDILVLTHKISGPLVRFQRSLKQLTAGEQVPPVKLRKGDLLVGFQDAFNEYLASLEQPLARKQTAASGTEAAQSSQESWKVTPEDGSSLMAELRQMQADLWKPCDPNRTPEATAGKS